MEVPFKYQVMYPKREKVETLVEKIITSITLLALIGVIGIIWGILT